MGNCLEVEMRYLCIKGDERIITYDFAVAVKLVKDGYAVYREIADETSH